MRSLPSRDRKGSGACGPRLLPVLINAPPAGPPDMISSPVMSRLTCVVVMGAISLTAQTSSKSNHDLGYTDTPILPGLPYHVHDPARPHPPVVTPSSVPGGPPSDAIVLFG